MAGSLDKRKLGISKSKLNHKRERILSLIQDALFYWIQNCRMKKTTTQKVRLTQWS